MFFIFLDTVVSIIDMTLTFRVFNWCVTSIVMLTIDTPLMNTIMLTIDTPLMNTNIWQSVGDRGRGEKDGNISWKWSLRRSLACAALQKCVSTTTLTSASSATQLFQLESLLFTFAASTSHLFFFTLESSTAQPLHSCFLFFSVQPPPISIFFNLVSSAKSWSAWIKPSVGQP